MKTILIAVLISIAVYAGGLTTSNARVTTVNGGPGAVISFVGTADTNNAYNSNAFTLASYDGESFYSYPISFAYLMTSVAAKPKVSLYIQYSFDQSQWNNCDTLAYIDSLETLVQGTRDLNNVKAPYYRVRVVGDAANRSDCTLDLKLYAYRKD